MSARLCAEHQRQADAWTYPRPETARALTRSTGRPYASLAREQVTGVRASCDAGNGCSADRWEDAHD